MDPIAAPPCTLTGLGLAIVRKGLHIPPINLGEEISDAESGA
jgi:hypothetical protein